MLPDDRAKWRTLAEESGHTTRCPWCGRFMSREAPLGMIITCNDCGDGDVVVAATREPFCAPRTADREPWPSKGSWLYDDFCRDSDKDSILSSEDALSYILENNNE